MNKNSKIYIAGHRGLVGSAIVKNLEAKGYTNLVYRTHKELDLTSQKEVEEFFASEKPEFVILAAAKEPCPWLARMPLRAPFRCPAFFGVHPGSPPRTKQWREPCPQPFAVTWRSLPLPPTERGPDARAVYE